jgi:hypothetical protein
MEKLKRAYYPEESEQEIEKKIDQMVKEFGVSPHDAYQAIIRAREAEVWQNDIYEVAVYRTPVITHLSIKRRDRKPVTDWRDKQEIKNQLVGPENEGLELYPAESRLVDTANQFHMWVLTDPDKVIPVGFNEGRVTTNDSFGKSQQRPRKDKTNEQNE